MQYKPRHFALQEFVGPDVYERFGDRAWQFLDPRMVKGIDEFREYIGRSVWINTWHIGGDRSESGLRIPEYGYYSTFSQHSFGRAVDHLVEGMEPAEVQNIWRSMAHTFGIGGLELAPTWTHADWRMADKLVIFEP